MNTKRIATLIRVFRFAFGVSVGPAAIVEESILMPSVTVGDRAFVCRAIVDANVVIPPDTHIGSTVVEDRRRFQVTDGGMVIVPEGLKIVDSI